MEKRKVGIVAECVCDLPKNLLRQYDVDIVYHVIETEHGVFTDTDEITAENILSHMENGGLMTRSDAPSAKVYRETFERNFEKYEEVVHIAISSHISRSVTNVRAAIEEMGEQGKKIHLIDSGHLSSGIGFMIIRAAELAMQGYAADSICEKMEELKGKISTSFMTQNANYLHRNGLVPDWVKIICNLFYIHPILNMKNGKMKLKGILFGNYDRACLRYVRRELKHNKAIDKNRAFITYVGCSVKQLQSIKEETEKYMIFDHLTLVEASATISSNCGAGTFGLIYIRQ